jgi:hypothetical protein
MPAEKFEMWKKESYCKKTNKIDHFDEDLGYYIKNKLINRLKTLLIRVFFFTEK